jgi:hypothetical protein
METKHKNRRKGAFNLRLVHISYNLLSPLSSEQLNTSQKVAANLVNNLRECPRSSRKMPILGQSPTGR